MDLRLEVCNLRCGYGERTVVENFSAAVRAGEIFCLLGPNGIGKTTLFRTILGFLPAQGGSVMLGGKNLRGIAQRECARLMAYVPQAKASPFAFSVFEVVLMGRTFNLSVFGSPSREDRAAALAALDRLGVLFLADRLYTELSGGERQMVLIARALAQNTAFMLLDEPTASLDFGNQVKVLQNIRDLARQGLGVIMTTHSPDHVFQCGTAVALMRREKPPLIGDTAEIMTEENLRETYGVPVCIADLPRGDRRLRFCQPLME
jgi:iron complex transport system ATP-binding protein